VPLRSSDSTCASADEGSLFRAAITELIRHVLAEKDREGKVAVTTFSVAAESAGLMSKVRIVTELRVRIRMLGAIERFLTTKALEIGNQPGLMGLPSQQSGARQNASVREKDGHLVIAKCPRRDDEFNAVRWETEAITLAKKAGIAVPAARVETVAKKSVLLVGRFDKDGARRVPFLSAMSMLGSRGNETRSYMEIVDALRQHGAAPKEDTEALWRRLVFNILISNTDDHLRNHGFLYEGRDGWRLSPAYDLNPMPVDIKRRILTTTINEDDNAASLALALDVAPTSSWTQSPCKRRRGWKSRFELAAASRKGWPDET
jgi:serine/threonine-protein kinase HipA